MKRFFLFFLAFFCCFNLSNSEPNPAIDDTIFQNIIKNMSLHEKVCQLFIVEPTAIVKKEFLYTGGKGTKNALKRFPVGGWIFFPRTLGKKDSLKKLVSKVQNDIVAEKLPAKLFFCSDEEGGFVSRLAKKYGTFDFPSAQTLEENGLSAIYLAGKNISELMNEIGFTVNFAPVADLRGEYLKTRSFSSDPLIVSNCVETFLDGMKNNNVLGVIKHFPGIGSIKSDLHKGTQISNISFSSLSSNDLLPFVYSIKKGVKSIMVGHAVYKSIDDKHPASLSPTIISKLLRTELQFNGLIISDSLSMKSITDKYSSKQAAVMCFKAGADILLMPKNFRNALNGIIEAVESGEISESRIDESLLRIFRLKYELNLLPFE